MNIVVTGGGTGGHLFPATLISERLIQEKHNVYFLGNSKCIEKEETEKRKIPFFSIPSQNTLNKDIKFVVENLKGLLKAILTLKKLKPDVVYSTGGFTTAPVVAAALYLKIPVVLHEQNAVVGLVQRIFRRKAHSFIHSFPYDNRKGEKVIGNLSRFKEKVQRNGKTILFMGGSGGAKFINELAIQYASLHNDVDVTLIAGRNYSIKEKLPNLHVCTFVENMKEIYEKTDIAVARAGSTTLAELSFLGIPSIIIPMPNSADNHQDKNAEFYAWKNAVVKIKQDEYTYPTLVNAINKLNAEEKRLLSNNIRNCYNDDAENQIVHEILQVGRNKKDGD